MTILRTKRLVTSDGRVIEQRDVDGRGKLVRKIKPTANKKQEKITANIPHKVKPLGVPGVNGYGELKFHQGIGHITLSQMLQRELNKLSADDILTLREVYDDRFIYSGSDGQFCQRGYNVKDGRVELADDVQKVVEKTEYEPTDQRAQGVQPLTANVVLPQPVTGSSKVKPLSALGFGFGFNKK